ncbi:TPA: zinc-binding alcohol dehydrogenase family protein [Yersinia enterocolitica]|uniref:quinone oxidoreductase family protein n=1 Tax=Yersinia enterocolitica TaxID=630 RepID=UPI0005DB826E|nr:zinc-binding alcohol dehydrogenase family protein [Yersinia enterocolitica]EKN3849296.1 zinc-binding alcohol dehydrogenase family protein [Yersinia enterocolitica]EKN4010639.1 zinc-binding alcohol dehydrogenase family protein [Yersinia enterocolitica]EKN4764606.1 zinc-binding alcohol dehydrogenase family protein [Yersinia enterocolitica]EKN4822611.1 zinc-binding alcohol dehydrogenase family protein [Yersinia enterocolitica]EKN6041224.1 zinc-binding alcohol dehydrogenase family protein [Yers
MKAAVYDVEGAPGVLKYVDIPDPVTGPDDILISVEAISIEGGDLINRRSTPPPHPSWIVGYAAAGTVIAVGSKVSSRKVGDRVAAFNMQGSHSERWAVPAERTWLIPDGVDTAEAAVLPISFGTAHHCLFTRGMLRHGETVLIQAAAGGVGLAAVQLASQAGATVIAVASGTQRRSRLLELGADHVVDRAENNVVDSVRQYTHGTGVDLVIDPVGTTLPASLAALAPQGRLVFVGNAGGGSLTVDLWPPMQSNQTLMGVFMGPLFEKPGVWASVDDMLQAVAAGRIRAVIDRIFPLANAAAAHEFAETAKPLGRIVMKP